MMDQFSQATRIKLPTAPEALTPSMIRSAIYRHASLADQEALSRDPDLDPERLAATFRSMVATLADLREELSQSEAKSTSLHQKLLDRDRAVQELERGLLSISGLLEGARRELDEAVTRADGAMKRADEAEMRADEAVKRAEQAEEAAQDAMRRIEAAQKALQAAPSEAAMTVAEPPIETEALTDPSVVTIDVAQEQQARARKSGLFGWLQ